jgi:hypothetical protein
VEGRTYETYKDEYACNYIVPANVAQTGLISSLSLKSGKLSPII